ncbi:MAG TPA: family 1 glycosylhydrolase [Actinomycetota bacterium]|nr:family 1 glycosylhydrolase [Actinomycetota bacterium]
MDGFLWGVATAAAQVEGGLNVPGGPENNWGPWERSGRVEPSGEAVRFWTDPHTLLDLASGLGVNAFRMSVEWARLQPGPSSPLDDAVLDGYVSILAGVRDRGMEPVVTLHHFTHPAWAGPDPWLDPRGASTFARFVREAVGELNRRLSERGTAPVRWWVTINEPAILAVSTYVLGAFPGTGWGVPRTAAALDNLIAGHVLAYDAIHEVHGSNGWPEPLVTTNSYSMTLADLDASVVDLLEARERGVDRADLTTYLRRCRARARRRLAALPRRDALASLVDAALHRVAALGALRPEGAAAAALYSSPRPRKLDWISIDVYDPVAGHQFRPAAAGARALRARPGVAELWEQVSTPAAMAVCLRQAHLQAPGRPIVVAENGTCTPGMRSRPDGLRRDAYIRDMTREVLRARDEGVPVAGYLHWTLVDNWEWGSYVPRFGLYGVDRSDGVRILETDAVGVDSAGAYREVVRAASGRTSASGAGG